jgi:hypothetical protein
MSNPSTSRGAGLRELLVVGVLLATLGAGLVWSFARRGSEGARPGPDLGPDLDPSATQVASQERSTALQTPDSAPAVRDPIEPAGVPPQPAETLPADAFAAKYGDLSLLELEMAAAEIAAANSVKFKVLLEDRYAKGQFSLLQGKWNEEAGGYWFTGGGSRYQATFQVPGSMDTRHYVDLPEDEYPEMYALKAEESYLMERIRAIKKGQAPK